MGISASWDIPDWMRTKHQHCSLLHCRTNYFEPVTSPMVRQTGQPDRQLGSWTAGNQPAGKRRARQAASQAAYKSICQTGSQKAGKITCWLSPQLPSGMGWELVSQASHLPARATSRTTLLPAAFCQWL